MENAGKVSKSHSRPDHGARKERRSATGMNGEPKKGGHGGKFTWSGDHRYDDGEMEKGAVDSKDPNFEDPLEDEEEEKEKDATTI